MKKAIYSFYYPPTKPDKVQIIKIVNGVFEVVAEKSKVEFEVLERLTNARDNGPGDLIYGLNPYSDQVERWFKNWKRENAI